MASFDVQPSPATLALTRQNADEASRSIYILRVAKPHPPKVFLPSPPDRPEAMPAHSAHQKIADTDQSPTHNRHSQAGENTVGLSARRVNAGQCQLVPSSDVPSGPIAWLVMPRAG